MYSVVLTISLALAIRFSACEQTVTQLNITLPEGEPCSVKLETIAKKECSKVKKFLVGAPSVSWFQAHINCRMYGYKLASITSAEENENILKQLKLQGLTAPVVWIGLNDLAREGEYVWAENVKVNSSEYLNWYVGEPNDNNNAEDCVNLYPDGSFNDYHCRDNLQYVCEYYEGCCRKV